jgi:hypothetical protein
VLVVPVLAGGDVDATVVVEVELPLVDVVVVVVVVGGEDWVLLAP